jgi:chromosome segregation ATPase
MIQTYDELRTELDGLLKKRTTAVERVSENERNYQRAKARLEKERTDVVNLEDQSLSTFLQNLLGTYDEKLAKEKQEVITAKIEVDTATALLSDAQAVLTVLDEETEKLEVEIASLREELKATDETFKERITEKEQELLVFKQEAKELNEAIEAGENVRQEINNVLNELDSASSMATWDMFSDSFFLDMMKYNKIDQAERELVYLERSLDRYQNELKDVNLETALAYEELNQMNRTFDIFFDNIFSDWNTRDTINRNITMLEEMLLEIEDVQNLLFKRERDLKENIQKNKEYL